MKYAIRWIVTVVLVLSLSLLGSCVIGLAEDGLEIHFIDVGQADAAIILCDGEVLMIDGGNAKDSSLIYSYLTKTLGLEHIDYMIATHPHEDHIGGLAGALNACSVSQIYSPVTEYDSDAFQALLKYAGRQGVELAVPEAGDVFYVGIASVQFISPSRVYENENDLSLVVRIVYGNTSFLFTGDAEWDAEHDMVDSGYELSADLLKVGHHGSDSSSSYVFLREVMPTYAVISVGEDNTYGHPTEDVLSRLRDAGTEIYRTDLHGDIICRSDGRNLHFSTERVTENSESVAQTDPVEAYSEQTPEESSAPYIGNKNSKKLHYADCSSVDDMKAKNKVEWYSREDAIDAGYVPCKRCNP